MNFSLILKTEEMSLLSI